MKSPQILLLFMAKYPEAKYLNFHEFSFRHNFALFKAETASDGKEKKKVLLPAVKTALLFS